MLGWAYKHGKLGLKIDLEASRMWLQKAATGGDVYSQRALGWRRRSEEEEEKEEE